MTFPHQLLAELGWNSSSQPHMPGTSSAVGVSEAISRSGVILIPENVIITLQVGPVTVWANILPLFLFVKEIKIRKPNK